MPTTKPTKEKMLYAGSIFGMNTQKGIVELEMPELRVLISPDEARKYAQSIFEAAEAAEYDEILMSFLKKELKIADLQERAAVLSDFRGVRDRIRKERKDS